MTQNADCSPASFTEATGTLTASAAALAANPNRRGIIVSNNSDTVMTFRIGGPADASNGISIPAGTAIEFSGTRVPSGAGSLYCAGTTKAYTIYSW